VAMAMLFTYPGVPTIFAGSEIGAMGENMDAGRVPFNWDSSTWDQSFLNSVAALSALRSSTPALQTGSLRWVHASADCVAYVRELADERVLIYLARSAGTGVRLSSAQLGATSVSTLLGADVAMVDGDLILPMTGPEFGVHQLIR
jgi:alpha-glucosidase